MQTQSPTFREYAELIERKGQELITLSNEITAAAETADAPRMAEYKTTLEALLTEYNGIRAEYKETLLKDTAIARRNARELGKAYREAMQTERAFQDEAFERMEREAREDFTPKESARRDELHRIKAEAHQRWTEATEDFEKKMHLYMGIILDEWEESNK